MPADDPAATLGTVPEQALAATYDMKPAAAPVSRTALTQASETADPPPDPAFARLPLLSMEFAPELQDASEREQFPRATGRESDLIATAVLGSGGMGRVLLARQRSLQRDVAVKVLHPGLSPSSLLAEAQMTGQLEHPHIVPVHALGRDAAGRPVLVLKRIEGVRWGELIPAPEHPFWERVPSGRGDRLRAHVQILIQVCNAVHFANSRGVIHRDIKPDNVMIGAFGEVYVTDWGVALATKPATAQPDAVDRDAVDRATSGELQIVGTPAYMAPEMVLGDHGRVDARTDVFLLGATLHEVLTGDRRHQGDSVASALVAAFAVVPFVYPGEVPAELASIANRATANDRAARYPDVQSLREALENWLEHRGAAALSEAAEARLGELRSMLSDTAGSNGETDRHEEIQRLVAECRFGFREALRAWPDQPAAHEGLRDALEIALAHELTRRDFPAARHLVAEIEAAGATVTAKLRARFDTLQVEEERTRARAAEMERLGREMDLSVAARERRLLFGILAFASLVIATATSLPRLLGRTTASLSYGRLFMLPALWLVTSAAAAFVFRRQLLVNVANRRAMGMIALGFLLILLHRFGGMRLGIDSTIIVLGDNAIMASATATGALTVNQRLWPASVGFVVSFLGALLIPFRTPLFFMLACALMVVTLMRAITIIPQDR